MALPRSTSAPDRQARRAWIERVLRQFHYAQRSRRERGLLLRFPYQGYRLLASADETAAFRLISELELTQLAIRGQPS